MRSFGRCVALVAVMGTAACSPGLLSGGMQLNPGCGAAQARAYHTTSQFTVRQNVAAIHARYSPAARYAASNLSSQGWKSLSSGECRR